MRSVVILTCSSICTHLRMPHVKLKGPTHNTNLGAVLFHSPVWWRRKSMNSMESGS
jgi:hypothetical protein